MSAWVFLNGWAKSSNKHALFDPSAEPIVLRANYLKVRFPDMVAVVLWMVHDGRFASPILELRERGCGANVAASAVVLICAGTGASVDEACLLRSG